MGTPMKEMHRQQSGSSHPQIVNHPGQRQGLALARAVQDRLQRDWKCFHVLREWTHVLLAPFHIKI